MTNQAQEHVQQAWNNIAVGYDEFVTPTHMWLANEGLTRVGLKPGMKFLDVACGSGALSIPAARMGAQVTSVDLSTAMVNLVKERALAEGLDIEARVMDGHNLDFENDTFDISGSQWGVMLFPDLPKGLRELARVTKPGGKVLLHCYGPPQQIDFFKFFMTAMKTAVPGFEGPPMDPVPLPFQVADPVKLHQQYVDAGLENVNVETITESLIFKTGRDLWDWVVNSNPIVLEIISGLSQEQESVVISTLNELVLERAGKNDAAVLTNPVHIAIGRV